MNIYELIVRGDVHWAADVMTLLINAAAIILVGTAALFTDPVIRLLQAIYCR